MKTVAPSQPDRIIIILGMHRSGTSCLTGSLQQAGVWLGEHSTWNPYNHKGNRENPEIMALHDDILRANGGSWDAPPATVRWAPEHYRQASAILSANAGHPIWGFKDPRTLLTLGGWLELGIAPALIGIFRAPMAVAASLVQRSPDQMSAARALELWYAYNTQLLELQRGHGFPLLCFDWEETEFHGALDRTARRLGLSVLAPDARFYNRELVHHTGQRRWLPWKIGRLYRQMRKISDRYR